MKNVTLVSLVWCSVLFVPGCQQIFGLGPTKLVEDAGSNPEGSSPEGNDCDTGLGLIAFQSSRDGNAEIYIMNEDGSDPRNLTNNEASDTRPTISPDGTQVAFFSDRDNQEHELYLVPVSGGPAVPLTREDRSWMGGSGGADWISNERILLSHRTSSGTFDLYTFDRGGAGLEDFVVRQQADSDVKVNEDRSKIYQIVHTPFNAYTAEVYWRDADGSNLERLTFDANGTSDVGRCNSVTPVITEDEEEQFVAARGVAANRFQLILFDHDGGEIDLSQNAFHEMSPDTAYGVRGEIVFESNRPDGGAIRNVWWMKIDGSAARQLTTVGGTRADWWRPRP